MFYDTSVYHVSQTHDPERFLKDGKLHLSRAQDGDPLDLKEFSDQSPDSPKVWFHPHRAKKFLRILMHRCD